MPGCHPRNGVVFPTISPTFVEVFVESLDDDPNYPLVNVYIAIENGHL